EGPAVSVVVPVRDGAAFLAGCLHALAAQSLPRQAFEVIVVDDGSSDESARLAHGFTDRLGLAVLRKRSGGAAARRKAAHAASRARWVAFTDADCIPSRGWLRALLDALGAPPGRDTLGAAGRTLGYASSTPAARFVDLTGGLDAARHLAHPRFPFAPTGNVM